MTQSNDDIAIRVEHLGKLYRIGQRDGYKTLRESMMGWLRPGPKVEKADDSANDFWALKDVNFEVKRGEVVGIIGRNGAGKSTLLKVLSRITEPTEGRVEITGRVGSLLEVGTGFHPELTGRENVFLNGAILGMREGEIRKKFDEIVAFAEIEQFIDTPVKRYSSGMYTRLAFAVAAHLEPEILIVDEVLAVGDAQFQKKCLGKMKDVAARGRTVLFVSHNMNAMASLCTQCVMLERGGVIMTGETSRVITHYLTANSGTSAERAWDTIERSGARFARLRAVRVLNPDGVVSHSVNIRQPVVVEIEYDVLAPGRIYSNFNLATADGVCAFAAVDTDEAWQDRVKPPGRYVSRAAIAGDLLYDGTYFVNVAVSAFDPMTIHDVELEAVSFMTVDPMDGSSARGTYTGGMPGAMRPKLTWSTRNLSPAEAGVHS